MATPPVPAAATPAAAEVSQAIAVENSTALAGQGVTERELPHRLRDLGASVAALQSVVDAIKKRLEPIVSPVVEAKANTEPGKLANSTKFGATLQTYSDAINDEVAILTALLGGIEL